MNDRKVKSHIQMPKCVLKRFEDEKHRFYYYDVERNYIGNNGHASSINTEYGYYSQQAEEYLNANIEKPFSDILSKIDAINFDSDVFIVDSSFENIVFTFMYSLIARSPRVLTETKNHSIFWDYLADTDKHDFTAIKGINLAKQTKLLDMFYLTFTVNKTSKPFVLSMCGIYSFKYHNANHIVLPVSPTLGITLIEKNAGDFLIENGVRHMYLIEYESMLDQWNSRAFKTQCMEGYGYVISHDGKVLKELQKNIDCKTIRNR